MFSNKKSSGNCSSTGEDYLLHGHCIAWWNYGKEKPEIHFNLRGWPTVTTRDRINGILELLDSKYRVCQRNFIHPEIRPHSLRHTFALDIYRRSNHDIHLTAKALNHTGLSSVCAYIDIDRETEIKQLIKTMS